MIKLVFFLVIALVAVGIFTGAIKIQVDSQKVSELPKTVLGFVNNQSVASNVTYYLTAWKRKAELAIAGSAEKKFELDMKYVEVDTGKLKAAIDANTNPADIIMKSKLLNEGIARAKKGVEEISDEAIARLRDPWLKILATADLELQRLGGLADEYKKFQEELTKLAPTATPVPLKF